MTSRDPPAPTVHLYHPNQKTRHKDGSFFLRTVYCALSTEYFLRPAHFFYLMNNIS
jgi:hypothetical protein